MMQSRVRIMYNIIRGMDGRGWGFGDGLPMVVGLVSRVVYERGKIMISSSDNSGDVVVWALVCQTECSGFKSRFILCMIFFHSSKLF